MVIKLIFMIILGGCTLLTHAGTVTYSISRSGEVVAKLQPPKQPSTENQKFNNYIQFLVYDMQYQMNNGHMQRGLADLKKLQDIEQELSNLKGQSKK